MEVHLVPEQRQPNPTDQEQRSCRSGECYEGNGSFDYIRAHILAVLLTPKLRQDRARNYCPKGHCTHGHVGTLFIALDLFAAPIRPAGAIQAGEALHQDR